jgi:hypothetical protein
LQAAASEAVFFASLSAEQPMDGNISGCFTLSSYHDKTIWTNTQHNKLQSVQPWYSGVAVILLYQEAGNHTYMHSNEAELPDTCAAVARCSHACFCTV